MQIRMVVASRGAIAFGLSANAVWKSSSSQRNIMVYKLSSSSSSSYSSYSSSSSSQRNLMVYKLSSSSSSQRNLMVYKLIKI